MYAGTFSSVRAALLRSCLEQPGRARVSVPVWLCGQARCNTPDPMGKGVQFDGPDGKPRSSKGRRRLRQGDKTALVLGGGQCAGGVYEMGGLREFDLLAVN